MSIPNEKRKERRSWLRRNSFFVMVVVPTVLSAIYYLLLASDIYVSEANFSVNRESSAMQMGGGGDKSGLAGILSAAGDASGTHDPLVLKQFVYSQKMLDDLEAQIHLRSLYQSGNADMLARLSKSATQEAYLKYYARMVELRLDEHSGILHLRVRAFSPTDARAISDQILALSERFVNDMSVRMRQDAVEFAQANLKSAEEDILQQKNAMTSFREESQRFNPAAATQTAMQIVAGLETALAQLQAQEAQLSSYLKASSPQLQHIRAQQAAIRQQIAQRNSALAQPDSALANSAQDYAAYDAKTQFTLKRYELALASLQAALAGAQKQTLYLLRIGEPSTPESAVEPERFKSVATVFFAFLLIYMIGGIIIASIWEHVRR